MPEYAVLGKRLPRIDALEKATGRAVYTADISLPGMLYGKMLRSPYAHAKIRRLDISKARALKGVAAVITADDVPAFKNNKPFVLNSAYPCMAAGKVIYAGQPVAAVAAIKQSVAEEAIELIEIGYEKLEEVASVLDAMKPSAPVIHPEIQAVKNTAGDPVRDSLLNNAALHMEYRRGDVDIGFKQAAVILEDTFYTQRVHQGYLEPRISVASAGIDGKVNIWTDCQGIFLVRELCSAFLNLPLNKIKINPVEIGGAFGGKNLQPLSPICALLSLKTGLPVKMALARSEDFIDNRPAPASVITIKLGADKDGCLTAVSARFIFDSGAFSGITPLALDASISSLSAYRVPNLEVDCYDVFTNTTPSGFYRAPQAPQGAFAVESEMDLLARALKVDPLEIRLKNAVEEGDPMANEVILPRIGFKETLVKMQQYLSTRSVHTDKNVGVGIACGFWPGGVSFSSAHININADGTVTLVVGSADVSGSRTAFAQIVAEEFGIPFGNVTVVSGDTETAGYSSTSSGSKTTYQMGTAVYRACRDAKDQIIQHASLQLKMKPEDLDFINGRVVVKGAPDKFLAFANLARSANFSRGGGPITGRGSIGMPPPVPMCSVHMAEVAVDKETGKVRVLSYVAAQDVGFAVNPMLVEGQMQGAVSQGIGWALMENYDQKDGIMQNPSLLDYRMPTSLDLPFINTLIVEENSATGPYGMRGVGEPPIIPCLAAIANAVHSAAGIRLKALPMTPEAVFWALSTQAEKRK
jgi:CO/xanthine dehydrogenase Mo-binding subunit